MPSNTDSKIFYTYNQTKINSLLSDKQDAITSSNKLAASLVSGLAGVATSGSYDDLSNTPTIPTVNNATLTIQKNGTTVNTFTANSSTNVTANITVPTKVSELTNDSGYTTNVGTITGITMNGSSKGTSGVVDLGTVITVHQDISDKADKATTLAGYGITDAKIEAITGDDTEGKKITLGNEAIEVYTKSEVSEELATKASIMSLSAGLSTKQNNLSETQLSAVNSGITSSKVSTYDGYASTINDKVNNTQIVTSWSTSLSDTNIPSENLVKTYIDSKVASVFRYKGSVATTSNLPTSGQTVGDVYNVQTADSTKTIVPEVVKAGDNVCWTGTEWDVLSGTVDISGKADKTYVDTELAKKENTLTGTKLSAVESGITSTKVSNYDTHIADTTIHVTSSDKSTWSGKQDALSTAQLNATNSGITSAKVGTYDGYASTISSKADKATTLAGYGITDAKIASGVITLGSNTITPLTEHQSLANYSTLADTVKSLSISDKTITYTKGDNTTGTLTTQDTTYTGSDGITLTETNFTNSGVRSISTGSTNGTISVNTNGTSSDISVYGLGSAAYTNSTAYANASHTHTISQITDISLSSLSDGQIIRYDSDESKWVNYDLPMSAMYETTGYNTDGPMTQKATTDVLDNKLSLSGGTITGNLTVSGTIFGNVTGTATTACYG